MTRTDVSIRAPGGTLPDRFVDLVTRFTFCIRHVQNVNHNACSNTPQDNAENVVVASRGVRRSHMALKAQSKITVLMHVCVPSSYFGAVNPPVCQQMHKAPTLKSGHQIVQITRVRANGEYQEDRLSVKKIGRSVSRRSVAECRIVTASSLSTDVVQPILACAG